MGKLLQLISIPTHCGIPEQGFPASTDSLLSCDIAVDVDVSHLIANVLCGACKVQQGTGVVVFSKVNVVIQTHFEAAGTVVTIQVLAVSVGECDEEIGLHARWFTSE